MAYASSIAPSFPAWMPTAFGTPFADASGSGNIEWKNTWSLEETIKTLLEKFDDNLNSDNQIVNMALKWSLYGVFHKNYQEFKKGHD